MTDNQPSMTGDIETASQLPLSYASGIGSARADALNQAYRLQTVEDLLRFYPRKYIDRREINNVRDIDPESGEEQTFLAEIQNINKKGKGDKERLEVYLKGDTGIKMKAVWFRGLGVRHALKDLDWVIMVGEPSWYGNTISVTHPEFFELEAKEREDNLEFGRIVPFYPGSEIMDNAGVSNRVMRKVIWGLLQDLTAEQFPNALPTEARSKLSMTAKEAYRQIHFPTETEKIEEAEQRLKFEELFLLQTVMAQTREQRTQAHVLPRVQDGLMKQFISGLPFDLTSAQTKAINAIANDVETSTQMNRLVQGDVGSGKTVVGVAAMLMAIDNGYQAAFMAPTEILAEQHYNNLCNYLEPLGIRPTLLTGSQKTSEQKKARDLLSRSQRKVAVGTHALMSDDSTFDELGLAVIDEQHRFGVRQRQEFFDKGDKAHMLLMTATPIPRSLAMAMYGDLDVTTMDEMPSGRKPVETYWNIDAERPGVYDFLQETVDLGEQIYVVCPLVENKQDSDLRDVESHSRRLDRELDADIELVHGQMPSDEKDHRMEQFESGEADILVATTVIEVGVDVENATVMLIENANQFGLSQLHQLRGRVGRSDVQSYCILMTENEDVTEKAEQRLFAMVDHTDGFAISEMDLQIRGTGDFMGTDQSGYPDMILADPAQDGEILQNAGKTATEIVKADPTLTTHPSLKRTIKRKYSHKNTELSIVG